jgi:hypothetical protein
VYGRKFPHRLSKNKVSFTEEHLESVDLEVLDVDALPHAHALDLVDEERVGFDGDVLLQVQLVAHQPLLGVLGVGEARLQAGDGVLDLGHLLDESVLHGVATQLHVGPVRARVQLRVGQLEGLLLVRDGLLQPRDVLLHFLHLIDDLREG